MQFGSRFQVEEEFNFPYDRVISKVRVAVRGHEEFLEAMNFYDQKGDLIVEIRGESIKGEWKTLDLEADQHIIGVKANMCDKYIRGLFFFMGKQGMGSQ